MKIKIKPDFVVYACILYLFIKYYLPIICFRIDWYCAEDTGILCLLMHEVVIYCLFFVPFFLFTGISLLFKYLIDNRQSKIFKIILCIVLIVFCYFYNTLYLSLIIGDNILSEDIPNYWSIFDLLQEK